MKILSANGLVIVALTLVGCAPRPAAVAADILGIETMPASVREMHCKSWGVTDILTTCAFSLDAQDASKLLVGLRWSRSAAAGGSYSYAPGPHVGVEFPVAYEYLSTPRNAPDGGSVRLVTDETRTRAQVDLYIE